MFDCEECAEGYALLELHPQATSSEAKRSYRELVRVWHPDRFGTDERLRLRAEAQLKKINGAYVHLCEHASFSDAPAQPTAQAAAPPTGCSDTKTHEEPAPTSTYGWKPPDNYVAPVEDSGLSLWRCIKVLLRTVWRVVKLATVLLFGALVACFVVLGIIGMLSKYWDNERDRDHNIVAAFNSFRTTVFISDFLGIPMMAVNGLVFLASVLAVAIGAAGAAIWSFGATHIMLSASLGVAVTCAVAIWAFMKEREIEFDRSPELPEATATSWVLGLFSTAAVCACCVLFLPMLNVTAHADQTVKPTSIVQQIPQIQTAQDTPAPAPVQADAVINTDADVSDNPSGSDESTSAPEPDIEKALANWAAAVESNDPSQQSACYAPEVDRYFLKSDVSNEFVRQSVLQWQHNGQRHILHFALENVTILSQTSDAVSFQLVKDVQTQDEAGENSLRIRSVLSFRKIDNEWKITSERDFKQL